jgi:hypothetical protein
MHSAQMTHCISITKTSVLILFRQLKSLSYENQTNPIKYTLWVKYTSFKVTVIRTAHLVTSVH